MEIPKLKSITMIGFKDGFVDHITIPAFLKHALKLEHLLAPGSGGESEVIRSILSSSPEPRTLKAIGSWNRLRTYDEIGLDALTAFDTLWVCNRLQLFECKIINIPRPDIAIHPMLHPTVLDPLHSGAQVAPHLATSDQKSICSIREPHPPASNPPAIGSTDSSSCPSPGMFWP